MGTNGRGKRASGSGLVVIMLTGFLFSPLAWAVYRLFRFMFFEKAYPRG
jgi:hypothetical protein